MRIRTDLLLLTTSLLLVWVSPSPAQGLKATRLFVATYPCDGIERQQVYHLSDSVGGHFPILAPSIEIYQVSTWNFTDPRGNARVSAFLGIGGTPVNGFLLFTMLQGNPEFHAQMPAGKPFVMTQQDIVTTTYICWNGPVQTTATWIYYTVP